MTAPLTRNLEQVQDALQVCIAELQFHDARLREIVRTRRETTSAPSNFMRADAQALAIAADYAAAARTLRRLSRHIARRQHATESGATPSALRTESDGKLPIAFPLPSIDVHGHAIAFVNDDGENPSAEDGASPTE